MVDRDTGEFSVEGPMKGDQSWNKAVVDAQRMGRNVRCFAIPGLMPDMSAAKWRSTAGGTRVASGSIVLPKALQRSSTN